MLIQMGCITEDTECIYIDADNRLYNTLTLDVDSKTNTDRRLFNNILEIQIFLNINT